MPAEANHSLPPAAFILHAQMDLKHMKEGDPLSQEDIKSNKTQLFDQRYECPVCLSCLKDPLLTKCGHRFCESCIHMWLEHLQILHSASKRGWSHKHYVRRRSRNCPIDGEPLEDSDLFPDLYTKREILEQQILCPSEGCGVLLPLIELDGHMAECPFKENAEPEKEKECSFKAFGCLAVLTNSEDLSKHLQSELHNHMELVLCTPEVFEWYYQWVFFTLGLSIILLVVAVVVCGHILSYVPLIFLD